VAVDRTHPLGTVVVTGGSSGLGAAVVAGVAATGGLPVNLDRRPPEDGAPGEFEQVDLADSKDAEEVVRRVAERHADLRGVVTCAGTDVPGARLADPAHVAEAVLFALTTPPDVQLYELVVAGPTETSWP
jgi:NADP-dependent 3-hydroxy acid dehydrogenase YdfG